VLLLLTTALAAGGCANSPAPISAPATQAAMRTDTTGAVVYDVDAQNSKVNILVYRGGTLARLGHNHVMTARQLAGKVWIHPQFEKSGFDISFQVRDLVVDDAQERRAAGSDFPPEIAQADREATRANMLKPEVLDAENFPEVRLQATNVQGSLASPQITVGIAIKDVRREMSVPVKISMAGQQLRAQGEFDVLQSEFGIKPFSVGLGALQVQDRLHIRFSIVAVRS
jgi:polyisoprenoid-binding protein YceI